MTLHHITLPTLLSRQALARAGAVALAAGLLSGGGIATAHAEDAEAISFEDYLASMDHKMVSFHGHIKYDKSTDDFTFIDDAKMHFDVMIDAGREMREKIQAECATNGILYSSHDYCDIGGIGTIAIEGDAILLSIERVDLLDK